jgi:AcrR family transcriptional regulator
MPAVKRSSPPTRRERARATRLRMMRAAYELFCRDGYAATTMNDVARAAGVAVQTVYFTFHTKAELLQAVFELAVLGEGEPVPPQQRPWFVELRRARAGRRVLRLMVEGAAEIMVRAAPLVNVVRALPATDDAVAVYRHTERLRRDGYREVIEVLAADGRLRADLDVERATDILFVVNGPEMFFEMTSSCGWSVDEWVSWCSEVLAQQLLDPRRRRAAAG